MMVCCESCPAAYHVECAGLPGLPACDWFCPDCAKASSLDAVERILDVRLVGSDSAAATGGGAGAGAGADADGAAGAAAAAAAAGAALPSAAMEGPKEYYVKWKERSYMHCSWVPEGAFERAAKMGLTYMRTRLRKFHAERDAYLAAAAAARAAEEEGGGDADGAGGGGGGVFVDEGFINGVHPAWLQVDRVLAARPALAAPGAPAPPPPPGGLLDSIAAARAAGGGAAALMAAAAGSGGGGGGGVEYLVKWKDLDHASATWERAEVGRRGAQRGGGQREGRE